MPVFRTDIQALRAIAVLPCPPSPTRRLCQLIRNSTYFVGCNKSRLPIFLNGQPVHAKVRIIVGRAERRPRCPPSPRLHARTHPWSGSAGTRAFERACVCAHTRTRRPVRSASKPDTLSDAPRRRDAGREFAGRALSPFSHSPHNITASPPPSCPPTLPPWASR